MTEGLTIKAIENHDYTTASCATEECLLSNRSSLGQQEEPIDLGVTKFSANMVVALARHPLVSGANERTSRLIVDHSGLLEAVVKQLFVSAENKEVSKEQNTTTCRFDVSFLDETKVDPFVKEQTGFITIENATATAEVLLRDQQTGEEVCFRNPFDVDRLCVAFLAGHYSESALVADELPFAVFQEEKPWAMGSKKQALYCLFDSLATKKGTKKNIYKTSTEQEEQALLVVFENNKEQIKAELMMTDSGSASLTIEGETHKARFEYVACSPGSMAQPQSCVDQESDEQTQSVMNVVYSLIEAIDG